MPKYLLAYHGGGMPESEEEQTEHMAAWGEWMGSNEAVFVDMGAPIGAVKTVSGSSVDDGGGPNPIGGYGLIDADDMNAAVAIAKGCPVITLSGGSVEVGETFEIEM